MNSGQLASRRLCCPSARILPLREDYLSICNGSLPEALLLQAIAWKTRDDDPDEWLERSDTQWASDMFDAFDKRTQRLARNRLIERGLIEPDLSRPRGRRSAVRFRLNGALLRAAVRSFEISSTRAEMTESHAQFGQKRFLGQGSSTPVTTTELTQSRAQLGQKRPADRGISAPVMMTEMTQSYIGSKNSNQNSSQKLASYPNEKESDAGDSLDLAVLNRIRGLEINGEPVPPSVIRNLTNAISQLPDENAQLTALEHLGRFCDRVRSGRRRGVGWGLVVTETRDFINGQLARLENQSHIVNTALTSPASPTENTQPFLELEAHPSEPPLIAAYDIWEAVKQRLITKLSARAYHNWIARTTLAAFESGEITVGVPDAATAEWIEGEYAAQIRDAFQELGTPLRKIQYVISSPPNRIAVRLSA